MNEIIYSIPRKGVPVNACPKQYRGVARRPFYEWFYKDHWIGGVPEDEEPDAIFEMKVLEESGKSIYDAQISISYNVILSFADAERVWRKLQPPTDWEIIWAADRAAGPAAPPNSTLLGFEPAYFASDCFSALSDCMCFPVWHGTDGEGVLFAQHYGRLNEHALFRTPSDAEEFLQYYLAFDWTEHFGDYVIAEVRIIS